METLLYTRYLGPVGTYNGYNLWKHGDAGAYAQDESKIPQTYTLNPDEANNVGTLGTHATIWDGLGHGGSHGPHGSGGIGKYRN